MILVRGLVIIFSPRYLYFRWKGLDKGTGNVILASVFVGFPPDDNCLHFILTSSQEMEIESSCM
jgi:hypothetical protein